MRKIIIFLVLMLSMTAGAQTVSPTATYYNDEKELTTTDTDFDGQAPLEVTFKANADETALALNPTYEWHFRKEGTTTDLLVRYEEETSYTFNESGSFLVILKTRLTDSGDELDSVQIKVTISESKLEMPNAFSPNGDGINDTYKAKPGYKSIISFHAYIFNRWGQKLYEWDNPAGEWDGTYKGTPVKDGVYFVLVKAKGADGRDYNIRRDVNILRGYTEGTSTTTTTE